MIQCLVHKDEVGVVRGCLYSGLQSSSLDVDAPDAVCIDLTSLFHNQLKSLFLFPLTGLFSQIDRWINLVYCQFMSHQVDGCHPIRVCFPSTLYGQLLAVLSGLHWPSVGQFGAHRGTRLNYNKCNCHLQYIPSSWRCNIWL